MKLILSLFLLLVSSVVWAQTDEPATCTHKDFREVLGPNRVQGDIGWCWANAAADVLTFHYHSRLHGEQASADYLALAYNALYHRAPTENGGFITKAIAAGMLTGLCPRSIEDALLADGSSETLHQKLDFLVELKKHYDSDGFASAYDWMLETSRALKIEHNPLLTMSRLRLEQLLFASTQENFLKRFADDFCEGHRAGPMFPDLMIFFTAFQKGWSAEKVRDEQAKAVTLINSQLDHDNIVAVSFHSQFFDQPFSVPLQDVDDAHSAIIAGRRWYQNECQFLVRNSYGQNCNYHNAALQNKACEAGNFWISQNELSRYLIDTTYLMK